MFLLPLIISFFLLQIGSLLLWCMDCVRLLVIAICHPFVLWYLLSFYSFAPDSPSCCACARGWGSSGLQTDAEWQRLTRAGVLGQRAHAHRLRPPVLHVPLLLFLSFSSAWSIHQQLHAVVIRWHQTCAGTSLKERRGSQRARYCTGHVCSSEVLQRPSSSSSSSSSASPHTSERPCEEASFFYQSEFRVFSFCSCCGTADPGCYKDEKWVTQRVHPQ